MNRFWKYAGQSILSSVAVLGLSGCWSRAPLPSDQPGAPINEPAGYAYSYQAPAPIQASNSQWEPGYTQSWRAPVVREAAGAEVQTSTQPQTQTAPQTSGQSSTGWTAGVRPNETAQPAASEQSGWQRAYPQQPINESSGAQSYQSLQQQNEQLRQENQQLRQENQQLRQQTQRWQQQNQSQPQQQGQPQQPGEQTPSASSTTP